MSNLMRWLFFGVVLVLTTFSATQAQNLIGNGELDFDTAGWEETAAEGLLIWHTLDRDSCGDASGSGLLDNFAANTQYAFGPRGCATGIVPGQAYSIAAYLRFPSGQTAPGQGSLQVQWFDSATGCDGAPVPPFLQSSILTTATVDAWTPIGWEEVVAPAGAHSVQVVVALQKNVGGDTLLLHFDGVHVVSGAGFLFADGFGAESTCRWSAEQP